MSASITPLLTSVSIEELHRIVGPIASTWPGEGEDEGNLDRPYPEPKDDDEGEGHTSQPISPIASTWPEHEEDEDGAADHPPETS